MACQCATTADDAKFPPDLVSFIDDWKVKPGCLIMILHKTQETFGFISRASAEQISAMTGISLARIYGVITFYHFFKTAKPGKYKTSVCLGTACYLKGGGDLIEEARSILGIAPDEVTPDGLFSIDEVRCVGCCGLAPVMVVANETYGKLTKDKLSGIFDTYREKG
ncbi:MAG: NAD(P)H-dependent oxidoreductase subunit E [Desulfovibrio sp.]|jgi:NADH-quinone oxidoreductase subunit E|nr:NAD(P)H-dependent oxidoreductase subunit E [Desulfovibrio sp.]